MGNLESIGFLFSVYVIFYVGIVYEQLASRLHLQYTINGWLWVCDFQCLSSAPTSFSSLSSIPSHPIPLTPTPVHSSPVESTPPLQGAASCSRCVAFFVVPCVCLGSLIFYFHVSSSSICCCPCGCCFFIFLVIRCEKGNNRKELTNCCCCAAAVPTLIATATPPPPSPHLSSFTLKC